MPTKASTEAIKDRVMPLLLAQHGVATHPRPEAKIAKLEAFVDRAIERGLTLEHVEENLVLGRPPHWIETSE